MARISSLAAGGVAVLAMIDTVHWSEIGPDLLAVSDDGYNVIVGSTAERPFLFKDYSRHPHVLNVAQNSTAAGASQFIFPTWTELQSTHKFLAFDPFSQDDATIELFLRHNALDMIKGGQIANAIFACSNEWASFPGGDSGQHEQQLSALLQAYQAALAKYQTTQGIT